jgi:hypothetical protein
VEALLATTARREEATLVELGGTVMAVRHVYPQLNVETVQKLTERLASVEQWLKETNEKLDRALTKLGQK